MTGWRKNLRIAGRILLMLLFTAILVAGALNYREPGTVTLHGILEKLGLYRAEGTGQLEVLFLDVGQGDSCLVTGDGWSVLIDAGTADGTQTVQNALDEREIRRLDAIIITHPHADHTGSLTAVLQRYGCARLYVADIPEELEPDTRQYQRIQSLTEELSVPVTVLKEGDTVLFSSEEKDAVFTVLHSGGGEDLNTCSLVMRMEYGDFSVLFAADAEMETEMEILDRWADLCSTVLKVGHHGSLSSTSAYWLDAVNPSAAVISCGRDNEYGYPKQKVLDRLQNCSVRVYRTDLDGTVSLHTDGKKYDIVTENERTGSE